MEHRRVGASGLSVSVIGLGSWLTLGQRVGQRETTAITRRALELGVTFIDTADVYGRGAAESALGAALDGVNRDHYVLATKCFFPMSDHPLDKGLSRKHVRASIDGSLKRLRTGYVDLYQCHRFDPETPVEELVRTMDDLVSAGKILHWGVSCWTAQQIDDACKAARVIGHEPPISNQPPYNLLERDVEAEVIPRCGRLGLSQVVFSPLAQGVLTGKYRGGARPAGSRAADKTTAFWLDRHFDPKTLAAVDRAKQAAERAGTTLPRVALRWCLRDPGVASVICGVTSVAQLEENVASAMADVPPEVLASVESALGDGPKGTEG
jgi:aryl-alcohol dehydrogenase-like predicted oxidoreductase